MADNDMVELFCKELELCKVKPGERIGILSEDGIRADYAAAFLAAAEKLGADAFHVNIRKRPGSFFGPGNSLRGRQAAIDTLKGADMVIDLVGLLWSDEQTEITNAGPRMLLVLEPIEVLSRMLSSPETRRRVEAASRVLTGARHMHITSPGGTDVTYRLGSMRTISQYGYTDEPGRWDAWPGAFVWTGAEEEGVDGTVVIDAGDMLLPFRRYASSPITLTIKAGFIKDIRGGGTEGLMMRDMMQSFNDPKAYAVSHIGWGLDDKADWSFIGTHMASPLSQGQDGRAFHGNVMFSTGPNTEIGGTNHTDCHLDIPLRSCSLFLDGEPIVKDGVVLPEAMRAPGR